MKTAFCPECEERLGLGRHPRLGQRVICSYCGEVLEVIDLSPPELDWVYDEPEGTLEEVWDRKLAPA